MGGLGALVGTTDDVVAVHLLEGAAGQVTGALDVETTLDLLESGKRDTRSKLVEAHRVKCKCRQLTS